MNIQRDLFYNKDGSSVIRIGDGNGKCFDPAIKWSWRFRCLPIENPDLISLFFLAGYLVADLQFIYLFLEDPAESYFTARKPKKDISSNSVRNDSISSAQSDSVIHLRFLLTITSTNNH